MKKITLYFLIFHPLQFFMFYILYFLNAPIFSVIVFQPKLVQRGLFEQALKVFGPEENLSPAGQQTNPAAIGGYCAGRQKNISNIFRCNFYCESYDQQLFQSTRSTRLSHLLSPASLFHFYRLNKFTSCV